MHQNKYLFSSDEVTGYLSPWLPLASLRSCRDQYFQPCFFFPMIIGETNFITESGHRITYLWRLFGPNKTSGGYLVQPPAQAGPPGVAQDQLFNISASLFQAHFLKLLCYKSFSPQWQAYIYILYLFVFVSY